MLIAKEVDNVPTPYQEFTTPIEEPAYLLPIPKAVFKNSPPPEEAVYEVINYDEAPCTTWRAKVSVYEDHRFDKNDQHTQQHHVYAKILELDHQQIDECVIFTTDTWDWKRLLFLNITLILTKIESRKEDELS